jgi:hypothetical protein
VRVAFSNGVHYVFPRDFVQLNQRRLSSFCRKRVAARASSHHFRVEDVKEGGPDEFSLCRDACNGSKGDIVPVLIYVRFAPKSRHSLVH